MKVALNEDNTVNKTVIKEGYGALPLPGQEVIVNYKMKIGEKEIDSSYSRASPLKFVLGSDQVIPGVNIAVESMKKGEVAEVDIEAKCAYGDAGCPPFIPPNSGINMEIELVDSIQRKKPMLDMTTEEKSKAAEEYKVLGNEKFKAKMPREAIEMYKEGINFLDNILDYDEREGILPLWTSLNLNMCVCLNSIGQYHDTSKACDKVLDRVPKQVKAKYLRGVAESHIGLFDEAIEDLSFALEATPGDEKIKHELDQAKEKKKNSQKKEKKAFQKLFKTENLYAEKEVKIQKIPLFDKGNTQVFLDIQVGEGTELHRVVIELFEKQVPKTAENFRCLCTGERSTGGQKLYYKGCKFHRLVKGFVIQGGDFDKGDGTGGCSIYGKTFSDEGVWFDHDRPGIVSMANSGKDTNGSQFFIMFNPADWLNKKHTIFGRVIKGLDFLKSLESSEVDEHDYPKNKIEIGDCGILAEKIAVPE